MFSLSDVDETFGGVANEARISGGVPITANTGGFRETIRSGINGFRVNAGDIENGIRAVEKAGDLDPYVLRDAGASDVKGICCIAIQRLYPKYRPRIEIR